MTESSSMCLTDGSCTTFSQAITTDVESEILTQLSTSPSVSKSEVEIQSSSGSGNVNCSTQTVTWTSISDIKDGQFLPSLEAYDL